MQRKIYESYGLNEDILCRFYEIIVNFIRSKGGIISYVNLENIIEAELYDINPKLLEDTKHHETAVSNGLDIFLHNDLQEVGFAARVYDLLHVGLGHYWQWNAGKDSDLEFYGDYAWEFANKFYLGSPDAEIDKVRKYEEEAGIIALSQTRKLLKTAKNITPTQCADLIKFYDHYLQTDLDYITHFYRSGELPEIESVWKQPHTMLPEIFVDFNISPTKRDGMCIPLISNHRNLYKKF